MCLLRRAYGMPAVFGDSMGLRLYRRALLEDVPCAGGIDLDAGAHGGAERDRAQVATLGGRRLGADELVDQGGVVLEQLALVEAHLADRKMDDRGAIGAVLEATRLRLRDGLGHVLRDGSDLRVRHLAARAEDAAEAADHRHHVRRRDRDVEVVEAFLDLLGQVLGADDVSAGVLGLLGLVALREDRDLLLLAKAVREADRGAQLLVRVADVQPGADVGLDRLVELGGAGLLEQRDRLAGRVLALAVDLRACLEELLAVSHQPTSTPIERAVPSMIFAACSTVWAFRSGSLRSAIWLTWSRVSLPTFVRFGSAEPLSSPSASRMRTAAGGVLVMNVNKRASKTGMTTGMIVAPWSWVCALNALQTSRMFTPCWPSAGPSGGAGFAAPAGT